MIVGEISMGALGKATASANWTAVAESSAEARPRRATASSKRTALAYRSTRACSAGSRGSNGVPATGAEGRGEGVRERVGERGAEWAGTMKRKLRFEPSRTRARI